MKKHLQLIMYSYKIENGLVFQDISYKNFLEIIYISKVNKKLKFNYFIKIKLGVKLYIYKNYYNCPISKIIKKISKFDKEIKENNKELIYSYIILKKNV